MAARPDRQGRAGPEDRRRHLPQERQGHRGAGPRPAGLPPESDRRSSAGSRRDPQDEGPRREVRRAARQSDPQAQFLWSLLPRPVPLQRLSPGVIADTARDVDFAIRWGYGWTWARSRPGRPPAGNRWPQWIAEDIVAGKAMSSAPLPDWVLDGRDGRARRRGQLRPAIDGQAAALRAAGVPAPAFPGRDLGESFAPGDHRLRNRRRAPVAPRRRHRVLSFKTKMNTIGDGVLEGVQRPSRRPSATSGLVIWQPKEPFSAGADLSGAMGRSGRQVA
jgi:3-hydroxyacyl-CoA dehydrogenase